jgi:hypothetical protein
MTYGSVLILYIANIATVILTLASKRNLYSWEEGYVRGMSGETMVGRQRVSIGGRKYL